MNQVSWDWASSQRQCRVDEPNGRRWVCIEHGIGKKSELGLVYLLSLQRKK